MGPLDVVSERVDALVGSMLGKDYRVIEPIGFGGMAVVYLVEHQTLLKRFAAKVLSVELAANLEARARFTQEAHAASQLDHDNIVGISDFGVTGDQRPFFVMELLRGQTLDQRIAQGTISLEEVIAVAVPVARALAHAHAEGIVHRDIKPENVFLVQRSQGRFGVKVVDFGIAKTPINTRLTKMGETLGSPMFMSPEACRGDDVDHRADIYSFGILLYLMLCDQVPFEDDNLLRVLQMQIFEPLPPPRSVNPDLSPELAAVIERALAKDPDDRQPSMAALLSELEAAIPPGADRLLIEAQVGAASSFRITPSIGPTTAQRTGDSRRQARVASQPLPHAVSQVLSRQSGGQLPAVTGTGTGTGQGAVAMSSAAWRTWWLVAAAALAIAGFGWTVIHGHAASPPPSALPQPAVAAPAPEPEPVPPVRAAITQGDPGPGATAVASHDASLAAPRPETVHLHVATTPAGAIVELDGKRLGTTPLDADVGKQGREAQLVISRDGFTEVRRRVELGGDRSVVLALPAIARPPRIVKRPVAPPPVRPAAASAPEVRPDARPEARPDPKLDIRLSR
jgi:serine/threonine-protein kinase